MTAERVSSKERLQLYKLDDRESWWGKVHSMVFWSKDALKSFKIVRQQTRISNPSEDSNLRYTKLRFGGWFLIGNSEFFLVPRWWQDEETSFSVRNNFFNAVVVVFFMTIYLAQKHFTSWRVIVFVSINEEIFLSFQVFHEKLYEKKYERKLEWRTLAKTCSLHYKVMFITEVFFFLL